MRPEKSPAAAVQEPTRLAQTLSRMRDELAGIPVPQRPAPVDALQVATRKWLAGERIEIGAIAEELSVARATLFRWVGSRELLVGEVIWTLCLSLWEDSRKSARGQGAEYVADVCRRMMVGILATPPMREFLALDAEYALRILTSKHSVVQQRMVAEIANMLQQMFAADLIKPSLDVDDLAYLIVRIVESIIYGDQISGREPKLEVATQAIRILVAG